MIPLILYIAKAAPAFDRILSQLVAAYSAARKQANNNDETAKNARNTAAIADAGAAADRLPLCAACPFAGAGAGSHGAAAGAPAVPGRGSVGP
jgi:hypothetical protein